MKYTTEAPSSGAVSLVPPGIYHVRVLDAKEAISKAGNDMFKLKARVVRNDGSLGPYVFPCVTAGKAMDSFLSSMNAHPGTGVEYDIEPGDVIGLTGLAELAQDTFAGKTNMVVKWWVTDSKVALPPVIPSSGSRGDEYETDDDEIPF